MDSSQKTVSYSEYRFYRLHVAPCRTHTASAFKQVYVIFLRTKKFDHVVTEKAEEKHVSI